MGARIRGEAACPRLTADNMPVPEHPAGKEPLDQLLRRLRPRIKQVLGRYHVPAHDAEDLVQEALVATIQKWHEIQDPEAWILVTLRNRCVVYWRKRRASLYNSVDTVILEMLTEPVSAPQERAELLWDLNDLMEGLPPRCRKLLRLRYGLGYDSSEVAERMGYHPASVRKVARRCMAALTYEMVARGFSREDVREVLGSAVESDS
ncbi:MAG TPA: sigma-70 family RNA polymerase sigma factor [Thermoanaerobaculia bacterium]|nr:sigma-70 family RNA polymerase sigma factor [Thermoanaerobaculia bacterium]